ncbi:hypothetical protein LEP1GSC073_2195 [Leptospira noguchii str. Cascata]|nr:hypothetical protein LEP1GSC072_1651 [Leptospira noguchii str. Bonito]EMS88999.1 hypothetical protein LEP1GSC073_2195 [Leptospira noguchii str. Cascata]
MKSDSKTSYKLGAVIAERKILVKIQKKKHIFRKNETAPGKVHRLLLPRSNRDDRFKKNLYRFRFRFYKGDSKCA